MTLDSLPFRRNWNWHKTCDALYPQSAAQSTITPSSFVPPAVARSRRYPVLAYLFLSAIGFACCYRVAKELDVHGAFRDWDIWFASDPNFYLEKLERGAYTSKRHPLVYAFVYPPAWAASKAVDSITGVEEDSIRHKVLLLGTPLVAAAKTIFLLLLLSTLEMPLAFACVIALIDIASASRLAFGSIP
jgi:hypothetical protein